MKHVVMKGPKVSAITEIPDVLPADNQLLIKTRYVGVCHSEHYAWAHAKEGEAFGHEPMGTVEQIGKNVRGYQIGDRVSGMWGGSLPGAGGMTEYALADPERDAVIKLPDNIRDVDGILEPLACMCSAVSKARVALPYTKVAVVGSGYMGCGVISLLKLRGAYVVAIDIRKECLENARRFGADEVYLADEAKGKYLRGGFRGFEVVMEWGETNASLELAVNLTAECGQLCVGAYHTGEKRLIDLQQLGVKAVDIRNTHPREWNLSLDGARNAAAMLASGIWSFTHIPVKVYPMSQFDLAQQELETKYGAYMKAVIDMTKADGEPYIL